MIRIANVAFVTPSPSAGESRPFPRLLGLAFLCVASACSNTTLDLFNPDLGLLAHWALDEPQAGALVIDSSGFGNHGTPTANPPVPSLDVPPGQLPNSRSLSFNGTDQWIEIGNPPLLNAGGVISVAGWIRPDDIVGNHNLIAHGYEWSPEKHDFALRIRNGKYQFTAWMDELDHEAVMTIPDSDLGTWVHLCGVYDGSNYSLYRNGELRASIPDSFRPPANIEAIWAIGARAPQPPAGVDNLMKGLLDDIRIYGRALSAAEVQALYRR